MTAREQGQLQAAAPPRGVMAKAEPTPPQKGFSSKLLQMKFMQRRATQKAAAVQAEQVPTR